VKFLSDSAKDDDGKKIPALFGGDVNDPIHPTIIFSQAGFADPFDELSLAKQFTWPHGLPLEDEPEQCLDFIFSNREKLRALGVQVVRFSYKKHNADAGEWPVPSDHYPVQATYELTS